MTVWTAATSGESTVEHYWGDRLPAYLRLLLKACWSLDGFAETSKSSESEMIEC